jgi:hypothetical protein
MENNMNLEEQNIIEFLKKQNKIENMTPNYKLDINDKGD